VESETASHLDAQVEALGNRPLGAAHYAFVWMVALAVKVREVGRGVDVRCLVAVGVNADGQREVLGLDVANDEDGAGWLAFLRSLTARGPSGVRLVMSDAHRGPVGAIGAQPGFTATSVNSRPPHETSWWNWSRGPRCWKGARC
jgi:transposase-like protein